MSPDSSSPTRRLSPPAKRSWLGGHHAPRGSSSSEGHERSPRARLPRRSRSPLPRRRGPSPSSSSHHRRSLDSPAPSRWPLEAGRTRRLAGQPSLSPRRRSPASHRRSRRSSWGRQSSPPLRTSAPNRHSSLSSSRSPSPRGRRSCSMSSRCQRTRSSSRDRISRPHAADQHLLRLRIVDGDQHPRDSPIPEQSTTVDDSQLSADKVQKLFADLLDPPALSHYADPLPDSTPSNQLVPYDPTAASSSAAPSGINVEPLETHGLFQNYQSFHQLSGDQDKEACTAAYHDLTNLILSQTPEEVSLINVSSSRPKPEGPYSSFLAATDELKKKQDKIHLQWPPLQTHNKVIKRTLSLYQHGPQPKSGTADQWPPPPVRNPWDKDFVPKDFPTTHKIPSNMPKRWDLHASSPLMLRPPQSTAVTEVPDSDITKCLSWLEAFAARSSHTSTMSATSMGGVYNFLLKISGFLRASAAKINIQNDITLVDDLIQRANSMALEAHLMAHDAGVTSTELFTHLHMFRRRTVLESPTVDLPQRDKDRLLVMSVGGNDLFGPDARKVHEWKRDTEEEKIKLISRVFDERDQRDKAEVARAGNRIDQLPVGGKLAHYQDHWKKLFPQHPEIVRKVSQGILIAFDDVPPSLLRYPLHLPSNHKTADLLHAVQKLQVSQAIEEVMDTTSPGYYSLLFLVPKPDESFRPIIYLKKLNQFLIVPSFKMETLFSIIAAFQPQEWIKKNRPEGCLPSHTGSCQHPEILPLCSSRSSLSFPCAPVRALESSTGIPQDISSCGPTATHSRHPCPRLLGRLDYTCAFSRTESRTYTVYSSTSSITGLDDQLGQINVTTLSNPGLSGFTFQPGTNPYFPSRLILTNSHQRPIPSVSYNSHACSENFIHHQQDVTFRPVHIQRPSSPPVSPVLVQSPVVSTPAIMGYSNPVGCALPHIPPLVSKTKCDDRCSVTSSGTQPVLLHRCIS